MKKICCLLFCICLCISCIACFPKENHFQATVIENNETALLIEPLEGEPLLKSSDRITLPKTNLETSLQNIRTGSIIEVTYTGSIRETYPASLEQVCSVKLQQEAAAVTPEMITSLSTANIKSITSTGTTGGTNGNYSYTFTADDTERFLELLHLVKLGETVSEQEALTSGAVIYYQMELTTGDTITISPGVYFLINDQYYLFENQSELWDNFITFNSLGLTS